MTMSNAPLNCTDDLPNTAVLRNFFYLKLHSLWIKKDESEIALKGYESFAIHYPHQTEVNLTKKQIFQTNFLSLSFGVIQP